MIELSTSARAIRRFSRSVLRDPVLQLLQRAPAHVDLLLMPVRPFVEVLAADRAKPRAIWTAERRDRGHEDELLSEERREVDLEVGADRLRVQRGVDEANAAVDGDGGVVLLGEVGVDRGVDRLQAARALRGW